jgi:diguanylate cyclase (GGDEF)-like protein
VLDLPPVTAVFQPVVRLRDDLVVGYEALARMQGEPSRAPDRWLADAAVSGRRAELERRCLTAATASGLPPGDGLLFVNLSPSLLLDGAVGERLSSLAGRVVVELSEQEPVDDYDALARVVAEWQERDVRVAIDDTGAGYASLQHVLRLAPDFIKLDKALVHGVEHDRSRRALVASFVAFARESGAQVVAEGVETRDQLAALRDVGVHLGQGYLLGRPGDGWRTPATVEGPLRLDGCASVADVAETVCEHLAGRGVMPSLYLERDGLLRCIAQRGLWQVLDGLAPGVGITGRSFRESRIIRADDVRTADSYLEAIPGVVAEACVPVRVGSRVVGALNIDCLRPLTDADIEVLESCGAAVGAQLEHIDLAPAAGALARLVAANLRLEEARSSEDIADVVLDAALEISGLSSAAIVHPEGGAGDASRGPLGDDLSEADIAALPVPGRSCYSASDSAAAAMAGADRLRRAGVGTLVVVPIRPSNAAPSLLVVASERRRQLHTDTIELLELLAAQAAARAETVEYIRELRRQASEDVLTGLGNRAAFVETVGAWSAPGSVVLLDIDHFKKVNDTFGHLEGDRVLAELGRVLSRAVRPGDGVYRLGGDEFAVLLPAADEPTADQIGLRLELAGAAMLATFGAGVSVGVGSTAGSVEDALRTADDRLYEAKRRRKAAESQLV